MNTKINSLECLQDGLFFGLEYLKEKQMLPDISSYCHEGKVIFKGQKILSLEEEPEKQALQEISFLLSYLSGAYTLISCFTERNFDFKIGVTSTKNFLHKAGEEQSILKAGAFFYKKLKKPIPSFEELRKRAGKTNTKESLFLSEESLSLQEIQSALENFPEQTFNIKASLLPSDLEKWRHFKNIQTFYPSCLAGNFPRLKMQWTN